MLSGRAWSGWAPIDAVEISVDDGVNWEAARLDPPHLGPRAWQSWTYDWAPNQPGDYVLCDEQDTSTPNGLVAFIKELGLGDDLRKEVLATLKKDGRVRVSSRRMGEVRLSKVGF